MEAMGLKHVIWAGKRVLLTGHTGFKGGWMIALLHHLGAETHGLALHPATRPHLFGEARLQALLASHHIVDIRERQSVSDIVHKVQPDIVIHMAAQALVRAGYDDPVGTYATNVMGTLHLFEAIRALDRPPVVINVTSDKCYDNREWVWPYRETDPMGGRDPYSNSKACAEMVSTAYRESFFAARGVRLSTARAGNVIGGGDWSPDRLVPDALRAHDAGGQLDLREPGAIRPWQHVLEPLSGYLMLAERMLNDESFCEGWNFGPDPQDVRPVGWVVEQLFRHLGKDAIIRHKPQPWHEAGLLNLDSSKARARLFWRPRWDIDTALEMTAAWHLAWRAGKDMCKVTMGQIDNYLQESRK